SGRWLRPPPPGRSSAQSLRGRAHQIRIGRLMSPPGSVARRRAAAPRIRPRPDIDSVRVSRRLAVLVNPTAGAGRSLAALPPIREELERIGADFRVVETTSAEHAREEARAAAAAGEPVGALGGDGLVGTLAGAPRGP